MLLEVFHYLSSSLHSAPPAPGPLNHRRVATSKETNLLHLIIPPTLFPLKNTSAFPSCNNLPECHTKAVLLGRQHVWDWSL